MKSPRLCLLVLGALIAGCGSTSPRTVTRMATVTQPATTSSATTPSTATASGATSPPATVTSRPVPPVFFQGAVGGAAQRPSTLELTGDGTLAVERVQWGPWGGPSATGSGNAVYHGCTPNCATAPVHTALVTIRLSNVRTCAGRRYYAGLTLTLSSGRLLDERFVQRSWSPC